MHLLTAWAAVLSLQADGAAAMIVGTSRSQISRPALTVKSVRCTRRLRMSECPPDVWRSTGPDGARIACKIGFRGRCRNAWNIFVNAWSRVEDPDQYSRKDPALHRTVKQWIFETSPGRVWRETVPVLLELFIYSSAWMCACLTSILLYAQTFLVSSMGTPILTLAFLESLAIYTLDHLRDQAKMYSKFKRWLTRALFVLSTIGFAVGLVLCKTWRVAAVFAGPGTDT